MNNHDDLTELDVPPGFLDRVIEELLATTTGWPDDDREAFEAAITSRPLTLGVGTTPEGIQLLGVEWVGDDGEPVTGPLFRLDQLDAIATPDNMITML